MWNCCHEHDVFLPVCFCDNPRNEQPTHLGDLTHCVLKVFSFVPVLFSTCVRAWFKNLFCLTKMVIFACVHEFRTAHMLRHLLFNMMTPLTIRGGCAQFCKILQDMSSQTRSGLL